MPQSKAAHREDSRRRRAELKQAAAQIVALSRPHGSAPLTIEERRSILSDLAQIDPKVPDPIKAIDVLNKMDGVYVEKHQLVGHIIIEVIPFTGISMQESTER